MVAEKTLLKNKIDRWYVFDAEGTGQTDVGPQLGFRWTNKSKAVGLWAWERRKLRGDNRKWGSGKGMCCTVAKAALLPSGTDFVKTFKDFYSSPRAIGNAILPAQN